MDDEIKLHFSKHQSTKINGMNVRCYPETFQKELANKASRKNNAFQQAREM